MLFSTSSSQNQTARANITDHYLTEMHAVGSLTWPRPSTKTEVDSTHDTAERYFY